MEPLAAFTRRDIWIDQASGLPRALSYTRRSKGGAAKSDSVRVVYTDYRNIHGVAYPFSILKLLNGTPWISITIQSVSFDTGLTGSDFPLGGSTP